MFPALLLFLLPAALSSVFSSTVPSVGTATPPEGSTGLKFLVAFPENIAHFHPDEPENKVRITALYNNTGIEIKKYNELFVTQKLTAGQTWEYAPVANQELARAEISNNTVQIIGSKPIAVHAINLKNNSIQTTLVIPTDKLGTRYLIPPVPVIEGTTHPAASVTLAVTERGPFRLIIINTGQKNKVTIQGAVSKDVWLWPHQLAQIWVKQEEALKAVKADQPVAVLFGHTCAIRRSCTCGQLYTMLPPARGEQLKFYIPPALAKDTAGETFVLLSEEDSTQVIPFNPNLPLIKTAGTAVLYRPGLLLTLIPETDFAACSVVKSIPNTKSFAVIVVHKDFTDGVHVGSLPLENPDWQELEGTDYASTSVVLGSGQKVIWHSSSRMAVYFVGHKGNAWFGNPAPVISKTSDFRGCVMTPEVVKIGEVAVGWRESLQYCKDNDLELVSFPEAKFQRQIYERIAQAKNDSLQEVWIGMRRSSQTGEWYWLNRDPVEDTNWADGEPGTVHEGQCVIMSVKNNKDFGWSDEDCCKDAHPVCYGSPTFFPMK